MVQYLLDTGARPMTGDFNMGNNDLDNVDGISRDSSAISGAIEGFTSLRNSGEVQFWTGGSEKVAVGTGGASGDPHMFYALSPIIAASRDITDKAYTDAACDPRLKTNVLPMESVLERLDKLEVRKFDWKKPKNNKTSFGPMANELEKLFPELVWREDEVISFKKKVDKKTGHTITGDPIIGEKDVAKVDLQGLVGVLLQSVKELSQEVAILKDKLG